MSGLLLAFLAVGFADRALERRGSAHARHLLLGALGAGGLALVMFFRDPVQQKVLGHLVMPAGAAWLGLGALTLVSFLRRHRARYFALACFIYFTALGNVALGSALMRRLEADFASYDLEHGEPFDAVFVLGGGTRTGPDGGFEVSGNGDRVVLAARLYHRGKAARLITSGRGLFALGDDDLSAQTHAIWRDLAVPETAIERIPEAINTSQEIAAYARWLRARPELRRVGVLSSAWHLPRVMAQVKKHGLALIPIPADHRGRDSEWSVLWLVPQQAGFQLVEHACWELVGRLVGR